MRRLASLALLSLALSASAQSPGPPPAEPRPVEDAAAICVNRLGSEDAEVRQVAYRELKKMRRAAVAALKAGANSTDAETSAACRELLGLIERSTMKIEGGKIPEGTSWWKLRDARVTADFQDTPLLEVCQAAKEDLGFSIRVTPPSTNLADRRITALFVGAPLEFVLGWLLYASVEGNSSWTPRLGWTGKEAILSSEQRPDGKSITVDYGIEDALLGVPATDVRALASFIEALGKSEGSTVNVRVSDAGLKVLASPFVQVDAARLIDEFRRLASGEQSPGADLDAEVRAAGEKPVSVRWQQVPVEDALRELGEKTGVRWRVDKRAVHWGGFEAWYTSQQEEPARVVAKALADRWPMSRVEQRWGAWWIFVDPGGQGQELVVRPAANFARRMMMTDPSWQPGGIESWLKARKTANGGFNPGNPSAVAWFPGNARIAVSGPRILVDSLDQLLSSRVREGELRAARLEGRAPAAAEPMGAEDMHVRIADRLGREKITKVLESQNFRENEVFQEVFRHLHDSLGVNSTSGSLNGDNPKQRAIRACRLQDVSPRVVWQWLNEGSLPWYLYYYPERRSASWGLGTSASWDNVPSASTFNRSRLHESWEKEFLAFLEEWNADAKKAFVAEPAMPGLRGGGPVKLPRPAAEGFFAATGLDAGSTARGAEALAPAPAALDVAIEWPAGDRTLEETLFKVGEIANLNFLMDVDSGAGPTRKVGWEASTKAPRAILDEAALAAGVSWIVRGEGVIWVTSRRSDARDWVWLEGGASLGADEASAVAAEFAKTGDKLVCFAPTGRFAARCDPARAGTAQAAFDKARAAAREAAREQAVALEDDARAGREVPAGLAGSMALETAAESGHPEASFTLARRLASGGHLRTAWRRFADLASNGNSPALAARAAAAAAAVAARFGPSDPAMDAEAVRLAQDALAFADLPPASAAEALAASAEAWRRAGDAERALDCYRRIGGLGLDTEDFKRWRSRLESLPDPQ